jgi:hypothetical protein
MIFRRGKKQQDTALDEPVADEGAELGAEADLGEVDAGQVEAGEAGEAGGGEPDFDPEELDAQEWRDSGPYDIAEVDLDEETDDDVLRVDLGSMVVTAFAGAELRLQVSEETQQIVSAMLISENASSALELGAYAAPRSGGLWAELRDEMITSATEVGGDASLAVGPFGVELRRLLPVTTPEGEEGYQPSRMWVVEGPRWLLRGIVYGEAALTEGLEPPVAELLDAFRRVVVRRGDEAMAPGDLLPLAMPENLVAAEPE